MVVDIEVLSDLNVNTGYHQPILAFSSPQEPHV